MVGSNANKKYLEKHCLSHLMGTDINYTYTKLYCIFVFYVKMLKINVASLVFRNSLPVYK